MPLWVCKMLFKKSVLIGVKVAKSLIFVKASSSTIFLVGSKPPSTLHAQNPIYHGSLATIGPFRSHVNCYTDTATPTPPLHPINSQLTHGQSTQKSVSQEAFKTSVAFPQHKTTVAREFAPPHTTSSEIRLFLPYSYPHTTLPPTIQLSEGAGMKSVSQDPLNILLLHNI